MAGRCQGRRSRCSRGSRRQMRRMLGNRRVFVGSVAVFSHAFCHWGLLTFIPLFGAKLGFNSVSIGLALTANALMIAVGLPIVGTLSDRIGRFTPDSHGTASQRRRLRPPPLHGCAMDAHRSDGAPRPLRSPRVSSQPGSHHGGAPSLRTGAPLLGSGG